MAFASVHHMNQRILDIDFNVPMPGNAAPELQGSGAGEQTIAVDLPIGDAYEIFGVGRCDKGLTLKLYWGFSHSTAKPPMIAGCGAGIQYDTLESIVIPANYAEGTGTKIGPIMVGGTHLKVTAINTAVAATSKFRLYLIKRT